MKLMRLVWIQGGDVEAVVDSVSRCGGDVEAVVDSVWGCRGCCGLGMEMCMLLWIQYGDVDSVWQCLCCCGFNLAMWRLLWI